MTQDQRGRLQAILADVKERLHMIPLGNAADGGAVRRGPGPPPPD